MVRMIGVDASVFRPIAVLAMAISALASTETSANNVRNTASTEKMLINADAI